MRVLHSFILIVCASVLCASDIDVSRMPGRWVNVDKDSNGILEVVIENEGGAGPFPHHRFYFVGKTHPEPTKWKGSLISYMSENIADERKVKGIAGQNFDTALVNTFIFTIAKSPQGGETMVLDAYTVFGEGDTRQNYLSHDIFKRVKADGSSTGPGNF